MVESRNLQGKESRLMMEEFVILLDKHHMPSKLKTGAKVIKMTTFFLLLFFSVLLLVSESHQMIKLYCTHFIHT